jgi:hypothetical protein
MSGDFRSLGLELERYGPFEEPPKHAADPTGRLKCTLLGSGSSS